MLPPKDEIVAKTSTITSVRWAGFKVCCSKTRSVGPYRLPEFYGFEGKIPDAVQASDLGGEEERGRQPDSIAVIQGVNSPLLPHSLPCFVT